MSDVLPHLIEVACHDANLRSSLDDYIADPAHAAAADPRAWRRRGRARRGRRHRRVDRRHPRPVRLPPPAQPQADRQEVRQGAADDRAPRSAARRLGVASGESAPLTSTCRLRTVPAWTLTSRPHLDHPTTVDGAGRHVVRGRVAARCLRSRWPPRIEMPPLDDVPTILFSFGIPLAGATWALFAVGDYLRTLRAVRDSVRGRRRADGGDRRRRRDVAAPCTRALASRPDVIVAHSAGRRCSGLSGGV